MPKNESVSELAQLLANAGYEVVEGAKNVESMIQQRAGGNAQLLCSGFRVFPKGDKCKGCPDCESR